MYATRKKWLQDSRTLSFAVLYRATRLCARHRSKSKLIRESPRLMIWRKGRLEINCYARDEILLQREPNETRGRQRDTGETTTTRGDADYSSWPVYTFLHSDERCPHKHEISSPLLKRRRRRGGDASGSREKGKTGRGVALRHFSDVFRTTRTRFGAFPKGIDDDLPSIPLESLSRAVPLRFHPPILMQIGVSYGTPLSLLYHSLFSSSISLPAIPPLK